MSYQLNDVQKAKSKALKVFTDTKKKFEDAIKQAHTYTLQNIKEISIKSDEVNELVHTNDMLEREIKAMEAQVSQIDTILGAN